MKRKLLKWIMLSVVICALLLEASAQPSARINYIDANGYPNIRAYYTYEDAAGNQVRPPNYNWLPQDIKITENGKVRTHNPGSPKCADPNQKAFSAILVFDVSNSMQKGMLGENNPPGGGAKWEVAFRAMDHFIQALDPALTECAIIEFSQVARIRQWFTNDKDSLTKVVTEIPGFGLNTNYNAAFLRNMENINNTIVADSTQSPLYIAKFAKYKPVIIFLTDGTHNPSNRNNDNGPFEVGAAVIKARNNGVYVFVVKVGNEALSPTSESNLNAMAGVEGNVGDNLAMDVTDPDALVGFYDRVLQICGSVGYPAPCYAEWTTDCDNGVRSLDLNFPNHGNLTASATFTVNNNLKPNLVFAPNRIDFKNIAPGNFDSVTVKVTAKNNYVQFTSTGFISTNPRYSVIDWGVGSPPSPPFTLNKDSSRTFTIRYAPTDSMCSSATIQFSVPGASSSCSGDLPVTGQLDQFVHDVNMGDETVNLDKDLNYLGVFCNRSCNSVTVTGLNIVTGDASSFDTPGITLPKPLIPGECINILFRFSPKSQGGKSSKINLVIRTSTGNTTLVSDITGNGIGLPGITSPNPVVFDSTDCKTTFRDTIIQLKNTGPIPLHITSSVLEGANLSDFSYLPNPLPDSIKALDSVQLTIRFQPGLKDGTLKVCSLHITSNASGSEDYYIRIEGFADSVNYVPNSYTFDLGVVCLGDTKDTVINLANVGTKGLHITPFSLPSTMTLDDPSWDLNGGANTSIDVHFTPTSDGPINSMIIFTEDLCNIHDTIRFIGTVHDPKVTPNTNVIITSNVGVAKDSIIRITNTSTSVGLRITPPVTFQDPQFTFVSSTPGLPYTIPPGGFIEITVRYLPDSAVIANANLILSGMPCHDVLVPLVGNPSLALTEIWIDEYTGYVGQIRDFDIVLRKSNKFAESLTDSIDVDVSFDASLLKQNTPDWNEFRNGNDMVVQLRHIPVTRDNAQQKIYTLKLLVTDGNVTSTPLTIKGARSDKDNVAFNYDHGLFSLIGASATLQTKDYEKFPGEEFDIEIWQKDAQGLSPFHESITTVLRCNATVLESAGPYPDSTDPITGERWVTLREIPINNTTIDTPLKSFKFKAMLGNADTTLLILENSHSVKGMIKIDTVVGKLTLKGICVDADGTKRLFEPRPGATLQAVNPNPTNGVTEIKFNLSEPGITNIWISNVLGDKILNVANDDMKPGSKSLYFDANDLPDGVYFVIMQTPTQIFKKRFNIIK